VIDGNHRREAEEARLGFNAELRRVRRAGRFDLVACARVATADDRRGERPAHGGVVRTS
jgi:predicted TIM-barrel enzyme